MEVGPGRCPAHLYMSLYTWAFPLPSQQARAEGLLEAEGAEPLEHGNKKGHKTLPDGGTAWPTWLHPRLAVQEGRYSD